jgi:hypothetical protein
MAGEGGRSMSFPLRFAGVCLLSFLSIHPECTPEAHQDEDEPDAATGAVRLQWTIAS